MPDNIKETDKDGFWDIEKLIPKRRSASLSPFASRPVTAEHTVAADSRAPAIASHPADERRLSSDTVRGCGETDDSTYYPENSLIKSVTVKRYRNIHDFYDGFRRSAILYFDCPGTKCDFAQFYSYMPQYSQLTRPQKDYYFYWRSELRAGRYIRTDYSYLYLYVYEVINLPDLIPPDVGLRLLCTVWREYRRALPRIDLYFTIWIRDYCLVHGLTCPVRELRDFIFDIIRVSDIKEFYFTDIGGEGRDCVWALIAYLSDYDWHRGLASVLSKTADSAEEVKRRELYTELFEGAVRVLLPKLWEACLGERNDAKLVKSVQSAFTNTLCTMSVKCKLEIEYYRLSDSPELKLRVTSLVRYIENKLRAVFGIKSRLSVRDLPREYAELVDLFFLDIIKRAEQENRRRNAPEYERRYDAPSVGMSAEGADEIERISWDITARLCDTDSLDEELPQDTAPYKSSEPAEDTPDTYGLSEGDIAFITALASGDAPGVDALDAQSITDRINEVFADSFGDIIIEQGADGPELIADYIEEITEWLSKITK